MAVEGGGKGFKIADAFVEIHADRDDLKKDVRDLPRTVGPDAERAGRQIGKKLGEGLVRDASGRLRNAKGRFASDAEIALAGLDPVAEKRGKESGGKLAKGMQLAIIRNSPLIAAAVAGALALGGPVLLAGATAMFAGIAVVAAAQSNKVQDAWKTTFEHISLAARQDAAVLIPVLTGIAGKVEQSFDRMRPAIQRAFTAVGPLIDDLADGLLSLVENAMPGFLDMIESAGPAFEGIRDMLGEIGTALGEFFSILGEHSDEFGHVFRAVGDIIAELLPILARLLGVGGDLASAILPALASVLGVIGDVLEFIEPILPAVVAGILALKVAQMATGWIGSLGGALGKLASRDLPLISGAAGKAGGALSGMFSAGAAGGSILAGLALGFAAVELISQKSQENIDRWTGALNEGGEAAKQAQAEMGAFDAATNEMNGGVLGAVNNLGPLGFLFRMISDDTDEARQANEDYLASLTPLETAQRNLSIAEDELANAIDETGQTSLRTNEARQAYARAADEAARQERLLEEATQGASIAMEDAVASADALSAALEAMNGGQLDFNEASRQFQQAIDDAAAALAENGRNLDINTDAGRKNMAALDDIARSSMDVANAIYNTTGDYGQFRSELDRGRAALLQQAEAFGMSRADAERYVDSVLGIPSEWRTVAEFDTSTAQGEVNGVIDWLKGQEPNAKLNIGVISEDAYNMLDALGIKVTALPDGTVEVNLDDQTKEKLAGINTDLTNLDGRTAQPTVSANTGPFTSLFARANDMVNQLAGQKPTPTANMNLNPFAGAHATGMAQIKGFAGQRPTPVAGMNLGPFDGASKLAIAMLKTLAAQRPQPVVTLVDSTFKAQVKSVATALQLLGSMTPRPVIVASANISAAEAALNFAARTRYSTIYQRAVTTAATGGQVNGGVIGFDGGGKVRGPGGPTDDLVRVLGPLANVDYRLSNLEWVIKASSAMRYGDEKMRAVNDGTAEVVLPQRRFAEGGSPGGSGGGGAMAGWDGDLHVHLTGIFDLRDRRGMRQLAEALRDEMVELERAYR